MIRRSVKESDVFMFRVKLVEEYDSETFDGDTFGVVYIGDTEVWRCSSWYNERLENIAEQFGRALAEVLNASG